MHPTNNPDLPSYLGPEYLEAQADLQLTQDVWGGLKGLLETYLPKELGEKAQPYRNRLRRVRFDNRFKPAIKGHAGVLSELSLTDNVAATLVQYADNIDLRGNDLVTFLGQADELVLRDGGCGILVEYPPEDGSVDSYAAFQQSQRRPYLVLIDRRDILNWAIAYVNGQAIVTRVTLRETHNIPDGAFGSQSITRYRVLSPGKFQIWELVQHKGKWEKWLVEEGFTSLEQVPLVWYSISDNSLFQAEPPFLNLAELNLEHLQKRSGLNEVLHKINMPVPVRRGVKPLVGPQIPGQPPVMPPLTIGPNSVVDVPVDGDFFFAEPTGNAIADSQADIIKLEQAMDRVSLAFLSSGSEAAKTATEVTLDTAQTQATLKGMSRRKESCCEQIFALWVAYTGEPEGGSIQVNESVLQSPATPDDIRLILDAMGVQISRELALQMLVQRRWLPDDADLGKELAQTTPPKPQNTPLVDDSALAVENSHLNGTLPTEGVKPA